jgi:hypothetical protein
MRFSFRLQVGPAQFRVGSDWAAPIEALRSLYRDYPAGEEPSDFSVRLEAERPWRRWLRPSVAIRGDFMLPDAVPMSLAHGLLAAEMGMNLQMALGWRRHLLLHAASVERDGRALILTGLSGSGKSTLAALLGERGWRLMGDEFALLDLQSGLLQPFPRAVSLKNESVPEVEQMVGPGRMGPLLVGTPKGQHPPPSPTGRCSCPNAGTRNSSSDPVSSVRTGSPGGHPPGRARGGVRAADPSVDQLCRAWRAGLQRADPAGRGRAGFSNRLPRYRRRPGAGRGAGRMRDAGILVAALRDPANAIALRPEQWTP